jgi:photosystem II stability/assembly factor-like uncharacterized protein
MKFRRSGKYFLSFVLILLATGLLPAASHGPATPAPDDPMSAGTFAGLQFRSIGPAMMSGRISSIAVDPEDPSVFFVAAASGGVWKTINNGTTFSPVFEGQNSYSIGTVTIDPNNPLVVWVGSGENNSQRSVGYGDGVYRSEDGGNSWKNVGLAKSEHIARVLIDPRNSNIVFVAAQGPLWTSGGDRGLFRSSDGGKTWKNVLSVSENTGISDCVMEPKNPDVMYASSYQRRRHVWTLIDGGPESAIYKSLDGGMSWTKLSNGLPAGDMGRIGLAISAAEPHTVYATIEAASHKSGFFRSTDAGASWEKRNSIISSSPQYYSTIVADPKNPDRVYLMDTFLMVTEDGGKTFTPVGEKSKHVDNHAIWIDPANTRHLRVGCDGGLYESHDRGQNWKFFANLPITQFYDVCVDNSKPYYYVYGGTQDNSTLGGPSQTSNISGITNADWFITTGGDGFQSRVDPVDPNIVYSESQYGVLVRFDRRTGEQMGIQPQPAPGQEPLRWNWDSPVIISPHSHTRLYFGANILYRSDDRGDSWKPVSGDLTRQIDRNTLPVMGKVWNVDAVAKNASTSLYGNCIALTESPKQEGRLYVGTDDGLISTTSDGGATWTRYEKFPGIPERTYVSRLLASRFDAATVYASFDNHKNGDFAPYLLKSVDGGKSWASIRGNLPANGPVLAIAEDYKNPDLLFAGTEFGIFFSPNGGEKWIQLKGGLPTIPVRDIAIQEREGDIVIATFGRGFYVLDDYSPLRTLKTELLAKEAAILPVKPASIYIPTTPLGGSKKATQGESYFITPNPPFGAHITVYLKDSLTTRRTRRLLAEKDAEKNHQTVRYPTIDELKAEDREEAPVFFLTVADSAGGVVRKIPVPNAKGVARLTWDLRYPLPMLVPPSGDDEPQSGSFVLPGTYSVSLFKRVDGMTTVVAGAEKIVVNFAGRDGMNPDDIRQLVDFQKKVSSLQRAVSGALRAADEGRGRISSLRRALGETPAEVEALNTKAYNLQVRLDEILRALRGDPTPASRNENFPAPIGDRVSRILDDESSSTARPTQTHIAEYENSSKEFGVRLAALKVLLGTDLVDLEKRAEAAGAPWTSGRIPEWEGK